MLPFIRPQLPATYPFQCLSFCLTGLVLICLAFSRRVIAHGITDDFLRSLREETVDLFYHGFDNYMAHAFPEDELKPVACIPLTRDRENAAHIEVNDVLGNYSLTLIDSLSTLAIFASSPDLVLTSRDPLLDFQKGVTSLVELYGDGSESSQGIGTRSKGFDLDSKVQVFETVIRGVGGLLSAHLFAIGDLPIERKQIVQKQRSIFGVRASKTKKPPAQIDWPNNFKYDGQLLRLAEDLAKRLVPAFYTDTGLPYPRVNLRHGVPFYPNSPLNADLENGICAKEASSSAEITETCSAGAGSLVLEFATLSRLTGVPLYEELATSAFWAVWNRRSAIDLIGAGIDAETGQWITPYTGIGAGIDSFFEYALKSYILLSGTTNPENCTAAEDFLGVWQDAHAGIKRHLYRGSGHHHPHYIQGDLFNGSPRAYWLDSLSAYYPGLLTLAGELDEAIETHMLFTALWTRYAALPERWSTSNGAIDAGLRWWGGRPEFIESTWYLYQATKDPWYIFVAEMALRDIKRRCWTDCGWAGLEDVRSGELKDRMESFFLGETAKYLYLLFDPSHPLNKLDAPLVFSTEGHPLVLSKTTRKTSQQVKSAPRSVDISGFGHPGSCPRPPLSQPFSISNAASRQDLFHAASLARLHQLPKPDDPTFKPAESAYTIESFTEATLASRNNFTFYPWTLPTHYIPFNGTSSRIATRAAFDLSFPNLPGAVSGLLSLKRVDDGVIVTSISGLRMELIRELLPTAGNSQLEILRVSQIGQIILGRDEKVFVTSEAIAHLSPSDPYFTRHRMISTLDIVLDTEKIQLHTEEAELDPVLEAAANVSVNLTAIPVDHSKDPVGLFDLILQQFSLGQNPFSALLQSSQRKEDSTTDTETGTRPIIPAMIATGNGAGPLPSIPDADYSAGPSAARLPWRTIYFGDDGCVDNLAANVPKYYQVVVFQRGGCSFSEKLENIPSFLPSKTSLKLVVIVSYPKLEGNTDEESPVQPLLELVQTVPGGMKRINQIPMVMVTGGDETMDLLRQATSFGFKRRYRYESQGYSISNLEVI